MKKLLVLTLSLLLTLGLAPIVSHAEKDGDCTYAGIQCRYTIMERGDFSAGTDMIYFNSGSVIDWGVNNNYATLGQFQVEVQLWRLNPSTKLESWIIPFGRSGTFNYPVSVSGNYMVIVLSGDYSQGRSYAYAWISR